MRVSKKTVFYSLILSFALFILMTAKLPYYIYKPGNADELSEMVEVMEGFASEGELHLVTVSGGQATPFEYVLAKFSTFKEVMPIEEARPEGFTEDEYRRHQLRMMENSQNSSKVVAYEAANKEVEIEYNGVYVIQAVENMPAKDKLHMGDRIIKVDQLEIKEAEELINYVQKKKVTDEVKIVFERDGEVMEETIEIVTFPDDEEKVGIGIQLVTDQKVTVHPNVTIKSGNIGGPSAGLMFALEMYNQLVEEDITKGYKIAGSGEIDFDGNVNRIGGIDKKVVAAHKKGIDIFFAPNEEGRGKSNFEVAKATAEQIKTKMKIVPIDTFEEAIHYLDQLERKDES